MNSTSLPASVTTPQARAAASLIVLRDSAQGPEVLLLKRADKLGDQNSGAAVFPGGLLDAADRSHYPHCWGLDDAAASARLGLPEHGLQYWVAAVRECFEESGLLFAANGSGADTALVDLMGHDSDALMALRHALHTGQIGLDTVCEQFGAKLAVGGLSYFAHWITPKGLPKIFDTRFFIAAAPPAQTARHDANETVALLWLTPAQALDAARGLKLMNVTVRVLENLARFACVADALAWSELQTDVPTNRPRIGLGETGRTPINHDHLAFAEVGRLDLEGLGHARIDLQPGRPVWLSPSVLRVTAGNGNMMTGPGTNSYFIGAPGGDAWALLDPGPDHASHVAALLAAAPGRITRILVTHTHLDHSPAAFAVAQASGAPCWGRVADHPEWQDSSFHPKHVLNDGDVLELAAGVTLRVLHTPGHASNHLCYLLEEEKLLFTGDHLMQGSTVVINPPDGDMAAYLASLHRLLELDIEWLAPGHGFLMDQAHAAIRKTVAHRLAREAQVLAAVQALEPASQTQLLASVYAEAPQRLQAVALRSLRAHLYKLRDDGRVVEEAAQWRMRLSA